MSAYFAISIDLADVRLRRRLVINQVPQTTLFAKIIP